jgi:hypothetical protein
MQNGLAQITSFVVFSGWVATVLIGHTLTYHERRNHKHRLNQTYTFYDHLWFIAAGAVLHPWNFLMMHLCPLLFWPLMLLMWASDHMHEWFNMIKAVTANKEMKMQEEWRRVNGTKWRICGEQHSREHVRWQETVDREEEAMISMVKRLSVMGARAASFALLMLAFATAPFAFAAKKAKAKDSGDGDTPAETDGQIEKPAGDPPPYLPKLGGSVVAFSSMAAAAGTEPELATSLGNANLKVGGQLPGRTSYFVLANFATLTKGGTDPIFAAQVGWQPTDRLGFTGGRLWTELSSDRAVPPAKRTDLRGPNLGLGAPLFDHGVMVNLTPSDKFGADLGLVTGHGLALEPDPTPDAYFRAKVMPRDDLWVALSGQIGPQEDGWRNAAVLAGHAAPGRLSLDSELAIQTSPDVDTQEPVSSLGWFTRAALAPAEPLDLYLRLEGLDSDLSEVGDMAFVLAGGANFWLSRDNHVGLRLDASSPFGPDQPFGRNVTMQATAQACF